MPRKQVYISIALADANGVVTRIIHLGRFAAKKVQEFQAKVRGSALWLEIVKLVDQFYNSETLVQVCISGSLTGIVKETYRPR
jgi:hypothetical protein